MVLKLHIRGVCGVSIAATSMGQSQAAGYLLPELAYSSMRRVISPNSMLLQRRFSSSSHTQSTFALKDVPNPEFQMTDLLAKYGTQVYGVATYDALFK